ncbi:MAG: succinate dehydrogenase assembly factor 2 [Pseudomonadota bacterium]|nr:succinate dehydrogenase assembly factor 2 [Pseudomonadota bacterium]HJO36193.1 succinate dehydrogenase assembly factor 2 [Gammaproteobacteria bacterium]
MSAEQARLRWRCRRGTRELDTLLARYLAHGHAAAPPAERALFERLLDRQDPELFDWLTGRAPPTPEFAALVERIRQQPAL